MYKVREQERRRGREDERFMEVQRETQRETEIRGWKGRKGEKGGRRDGERKGEKGTGTYSMTRRKDRDGEKDRKDMKG